LARGKVVSENYGGEIEVLKTDFDNLTKIVEKISDKFDKFTDQLQPKPLSIPVMISSMVGILTFFVIVFGTIVWTINSSIAPMSTKLEEIMRNNNEISGRVMQNNNGLQLLNKEISRAENQAKGNTETLQWALFDENLPKQIIINCKEIESLKAQLNELKEKK